MTPRARRWLVIAGAAAVVALGVPFLFRPGYSPDEEFTVFAVRGIRAHGLPLLPSGLLYDRGLLYSYAAWLAATVTGLELPAFRGLSLLCGAGVLGLGYALVGGAVSPAAGAAAAVFVAGSLPFWAAATTGRFYAPFLLTCVAVLAAVARLPGVDGPHRSALVAPGSGPGGTSPGGLRGNLATPVSSWLALAALAFLSRLTHELAFTLMAIPAAGAALAFERGAARRLAVPASPATPPSAASAAALSAPSAALSAGSAAALRPWILISAALATGLIAAQSVLTGLHFLAPGTGGSVMVQRFFLWQVLNLFERPSGAPLGVVLAGVAVAWLIVPARAAFTLVAGLCAAAAILTVSAALSAPALSGALAYPLDMFWHLAGVHPVMTSVALTLLVARLCRAGGEWQAAERAAHLGWVGWALWFGVIESGITLNYVLLPTVCMLAAIGIDLVAIGQHAAALWPGRRAQVMRAALTGAALVVLADQWPGTGTLPQRLVAARPTIDVAGIDEVRPALQAADRVACTDELACLLLVGRVDAWLALDDYVRDRFVVTRGSRPVGVYAGAPALFGLDGLFAPDGNGTAPARVIVVDVFKAYPIGNSREWLARALDADRIQARSLLSSPQARILELVNRD